MKKFLTYSNLTVLSLFLSISSFAQKDIFKGIFEKENPEFNTSIIPTDQEGEVLLVYYFSHSKVSTLDASIWIKDNGENLLNDGAKQMIRDLKTIGNRQKDTVRITGLKNKNFYSVGLDYKQANAFKTRFVSRVLQEGFLYEYDAEESEEIVETVPKNNRPTKSEPTVNNPCESPEIFIRVENAGYCSDADRPAIIVECENCFRKDWEFSVEIRTELKTWQTVRSDGQRQKAFGNVRRTEPLCVLAPGAYYVRVLAWGENCDAPMVYNVTSPVRISDMQFKSSVAFMSDKQEVEPQPSRPAVELPDSCVVNGWGMLYGNFIQGTLEMRAGSPCQDMAPYAKVTYIHPGHRNIVTPPISLTAGSKIPFEIELDEKDMERGVHPVQVIVYIRPTTSNTESIPISSFWIRAKGKNQPDLDTRPSLGDWSDASTENPATEADDSNCTKMNDLQLIFASKDPTQPRYISWANPNCCQDETCSYFVWAGSNPVDLRLLSQGKKQGSVVRESLQGLSPEDKFFEVVVSSTGGTRRASYVIGEGASYEEGGLAEYNTQQGNAGRNEIIASRGLTEMPMSANLIPKRPLTDFGACKIYREVAVVGDFPINEGDDVSINYDHTGSGYQYTLYHQPMGVSEWLIAPGTVEMQNSPKFLFTTSQEHSGKYIVLVYKASKKWGCLSALPNDSLKLSVLK